MYLFKLQFPKAIYPGMGLLGHMVALISVVEGISILFSIEAEPIYIPSSSVGGFPSLHTLSSIYLWIFNHSDWCVGISYGNFDLHSSNN